MSAERLFGKRPDPPKKVYVRVQQVQGNKVLATRSFQVMGHSHKEVSEVVEAGLAGQFASQAEPEAKPIRNTLRWKKKP